MSINAIYSTNLQKKFSELDKATIKSIDDKTPVAGNLKLIFNGTKEDYDNLSEEDKLNYSLVNLSDVGGNGEISVVDAVEEDNLISVTSNAVYKVTKSLQDQLDSKTSLNEDVTFNSVSAKEPLYVYPKDIEIENATTRTFINDKGIELQVKENDAWISKGTLKRDNNNNLFITNTDLTDSSLPQTSTEGVTVLDPKAIIYHLENSSTDSKGSNTAKFTFNIKKYGPSELIKNGKYLLLDGSVEKAIEVEDICLFTNSDIFIDNNRIDLSTGNVDTKVKDWNNKFKVKFFEWSNV